GMHALLGRPVVLLSYLMTAVVMMGGFLLIPNFSAYIQFNLHFPRKTFFLLYLVGGVASFLTVQLVGRLVDRFGSFKVGAPGSFAVLVITYFFFIDYAPAVPVMFPFVGFMIAMAFRNVSYNTL